MTSLLILGSTNSGKTVLGAQLYGRARYTEAALTLRGQAKDIKVLDHAFKSLQRGMLPSRTGESTYGTLTLPLRRSETGEELDLIWPDYGGEQFDEIVEARQLSPEWTQRVEAASGLLLLIRPKRTRVSPDVLTQPGLKDADQSAYAEPAKSELGQLTLDSAYVEMMQLLTHTKRLSRARRYTWPLTVVLTCWDEVASEGLTPEAILQRGLPLFWQYLQGTWDQNLWQTVGLSALERPLKNADGQELNAPESQVAEGSTKLAASSQVEAAAQSDTRFREARPQTQGYLVDASGTRTSDLTLAVESVLEGVAADAT